MAESTHVWSRVRGSIYAVYFFLRGHLFRKGESPRPLHRVMHTAVLLRSFKYQVLQITDHIRLRYESTIEKKTTYSI